jgi:2-iminobutanoate/2-iminopropanoate deaminase
MKQVFLTEKGPKAVGPYSTAVVHGDTAYLSGMIPLDPATGELVPGGIEAQSRQVFENIQTVMGEMGLTMKDALKVNVFLTDMAAFGAMNAVYAEYFGPDYPARSCVAVLALPKGALVEAEVVAAAR